MFIFYSEKLFNYKVNGKTSYGKVMNEEEEEEQEEDVEEEEEEEVVVVVEGGR